MNYATIIFYVSFLGIIGMLWMKRIEVKREKKSILSRIGAPMDTVVSDVYDSVRFVISHINVHNSIVAVQWVAFHVLSAARRSYMRARELAHSHPHSKKVIDMVTGRGELNQNGGASFYLKRIGEEGKTGIK